MLETIQMRYALVDGQKLEAKKGIIGAVCPCCGNPVTPKCGSIKMHHWSHENKKDCDSWYEPMTEWHINWQNLFPENCREVIIGVHRADVLYKGCVFEFQHSPLSEEEIKDREAYYQNMMWVFDLQKKYDKQQLKFFKMREKKIFNYGSLEDYDEVSFTFGIREISEIELEQIKINDNYSQIEEVFMQMIRPIKTLLAVRSGSQNVDIAFDLGGDLIFLVNSYKNNQVDDIPHVIVFYGSHVHGSKMHDVDKYCNYSSHQISFYGNISSFRGFYGKLLSKQKFIESILKL